MSQMHQMQLTYVATEDRMLFRVNTKARQEFRFWMTRRYVAILWHTLMQILAKTQAETQESTGTPAPDPLVEAAKKEMKHQEVVSQADFKTQYQESTYLPLGEQPILLFGIGVKPAPDGQPLLCMHPHNGQGIEMVMGEQILHSFCKLIQDTVAKAEWGLNLSFTPDGPTQEGPRGLN